MTPQLKEALQAVEKLTPAERQELLRIVSNVQEEPRMPSGTDPLERVLATQSPIVVQDVTLMKADFWPADESVEAFLAWREENKAQDIASSRGRLDTLLKDAE
ncbi:MAG: hypothetical protein KDD89_16200 [Anaerolineales bacterium]|nr:hypothetical protein [Anaerolineales bacterium]